MVKIDVMSAQERKSQETRRKILEATERLLSEYDFKYLTVRNICAEGDVAYGSFYHHFRNKENLLYIYGKELFKVNREHNPCPDWISQDNYISVILWHFVVFGEFCAAMGKQFIRCIHQEGSMDLFGETYERVIIPIIRKAHRDGYIRDYEGQNAVENIIKDLRIVYQGIIMWWCAQPEDKEPLAATMEHLLLHMVSSRRSEKGAEMATGRLLTDMDYKKDIHLEHLPGMRSGTELLES